MRELPVVDLADLDSAAEDIDRACREVGFFYVVGHGVDPGLVERLDELSRAFFARPDDEKAEIAMARGGRAWRGWFPVGGELTSGAPDRKEGIYFGAELGVDHLKVRAGVPLHGPNLLPSHPADLRSTVLAYLNALTGVAHRLAEGMSLALGLDRGWMRTNLTGDPLILFRIFHYPPEASPSSEEWGVGEHTDYGLLTLLRQDGHGGLQVKALDGTAWIDAPPVPDSFVCNLGDMLERMTGGVYRSTPHRVRNTSGGSRLSFPFFFDPGWDVVVPPLPRRTTSAARERWDGADPVAFEGTYGEYVLSKVAKVFPDLHDEAIG